MKNILEVTISLAAGGSITSFAEYKLNYNLIDLIVDKVKALTGAVTSDAKKIETKVVNDVKKL